MFGGGADSSAASGGGLLDGLVGLVVPGVELQQAAGSWTSLRDLASRRPLVVWFFAGADAQRGPTSRAQAEQDSARAAGWAAVEGALVAAGYELVGVSAQSSIVQAGFASREELLCRFLSDPDLDLARELALPTQGLEYAPFYEPLTLVVREKKIVRVLYPVDEGETGRVLAWVVK